MGNMSRWFGVGRASGEKPLEILGLFLRASIPKTPARRWGTSTTLTLLKILPRHEIASDELPFLPRRCFPLLGLIKSI